MRVIDRLGLAQKIVVVIALGMAFAAVGSYLTRLGGPGAGWYAYAPLSHTVFPPRAGLPGWARLIVWLALTGVWALASVRVLRPDGGVEPRG